MISCIKKELPHRGRPRPSTTPPAAEEMPEQVLAAPLLDQSEAVNALDRSIDATTAELPNPILNIHHQQTFSAQGRKVKQKFFSSYNEIGACTFSCSESISNSISDFWFQPKPTVSSQPFLSVCAASHFPDYSRRRRAREVYARRASHVMQCAWHPWQLHQHAGSWGRA